MKLVMILFPRLVCPSRDETDHIFGDHELCSYPVGTRYSATVTRNFRLEPSLHRSGCPFRQTTSEVVRRCWSVPWRQSSWHTRRKCQTSG